MALNSKKEDNQSVSSAKKRQENVSIKSHDLTFNIKLSASRRDFLTEFTKEFYAKYGKMMSKLASE